MDYGTHCQGNTEWLIQPSSMQDGCLCFNGLHFLGYESAMILVRNLIDDSIAVNFWVVSCATF